MEHYFGPMGGLTFIFCLIALITGSPAMLLISIFASLIIIFYYDSSIADKGSAAFTGFFIFLFIPFLIFLLVPGYYIYALVKYIGSKA